MKMCASSSSWLSEHVASRPSARQVALLAFGTDSPLCSQEEPGQRQEIRGHRLGTVLDGNLRPGGSRHGPSIEAKVSVKKAYTMIRAQLQEP
jgi:hypothetical protein